MAHRLKDYKEKPKDVSDRRSEQSVVIVERRKAKKDDQLLDRRNLDLEEGFPVHDRIDSDEPLLTLDYMKKLLGSTKTEEVLRGAQELNKFLSCESKPVDKILEAGFLPHVVMLLLFNDRPDIQYEAAWTLTYVAADHATSVVNAGAVLPLINLLSLQDLKVREQALLALGNISADAGELRNLVVNNGFVGELVRLITPSTSIPLLQRVAWSVLNVCRIKNTRAPVASIKCYLPSLVCLLRSADSKVLSDVCSALCYLTADSADMSQEVIKAGLVPNLVQLLKNPVDKVLSPALSTVGNIIAGDEEHMQHMLDLDVLPYIHRLLAHNDSNIQKVAAWTISNITIGSASQIELVISTGLIPSVIHLLRHSDSKVQEKAVHVINNLTYHGTAAQIAYCVEVGVLNPLCDLLATKEERMIILVMDALQHIMRALKMFDHSTSFAAKFEEVHLLLHQAEVHRMKILEKRISKKLTRFDNRTRRLKKSGDQISQLLCAIEKLNNSVHAHALGDKLNECGQRLEQLEEKIGGGQRVDGSFSSEDGLQNIGHNK